MAHFDWILGKLNKQKKGCVLEVESEKNVARYSIQVFVLAFNQQEIVGST